MLHKLIASKYTMEAKEFGAYLIENIALDNDQNKKLFGNIFLKYLYIHFIYISVRDILCKFKVLIHNIS